VGAAGFGASVRRCLSAPGKGGASGNSLFSLHLRHFVFDG